MALYPFIPVQSQWVDLYDATGIAAGTQIIVQVFQSKSPVAFSDAEAEPASDEPRIISPQGGQVMFIDGSLGAWAYCSSSAQLTVQDARYPEIIPPGFNGEPIPQGAFTGLRAMTIQGYIEANIKNGLQFYVRKSYPLGSEIGGGDSVELLFRTTTKTIIPKSRVVSYIGEEFQIEIFESPTLTDDGTPINPSNFNRVNPVASTVEFYESPTATADGTPIEPEPEYYFGAASAIFRNASALSESRERILPPNTDYLIRITNNDTGAGRFSYFLDWYEGDPDLPLP